MESLEHVESLPPRGGGDWKIENTPGTKEYVVAPWVGRGLNYKPHCRTGTLLKIASQAGRGLERQVSSCWPWAHLCSPSGRGFEYLWCRWCSV